MEIHTYPEMNQKIKDILRLGDDPMCLYAAARIEELETLLAAAVKEARSLREVLERAKTKRYSHARLRTMLQTGGEGLRWLQLVEVARLRR